jgi:hypothetical protein
MGGLPPPYMLCFPIIDYLMGGTASRLICCAPPPSITDVVLNPNNNLPLSHTSGWSLPPMTLLRLDGALAPLV